MIDIEFGQITIYDRADISRIEVIKWYESEWEHEPRLVLVIAHCIAHFYNKGVESLLENLVNIHEKYHCNLWR